MAEFLFVHSTDGGWWLKIDSIDQLAEYHQQADGDKYGKALEMYMDMKQQKKSFEEAMMEMPLQKRIEMMADRNFKYLHCAIIEAQRNGSNIFDGFRALNIETGYTEMENIKQYGAVFINRVGGHTHGIEYDQFCRRSAPVFPDYKREDIRVKQFRGGRHWYAYIGDMQVRNGDQLKWNTYEEAQQAAEMLVEA